MNTMEQIFGNGTELTVFQMAARAAVMFFITLILIRISGRRSFSFHSSVDSIISITLGAVLSRGIVGASPFWSVVAAGLVISLLHRFLYWFGVHSHWLQRVMSGRRILLYADGQFDFENMQKALVTKQEVIDTACRKTHKEGMDGVEKVYISSTGAFIVVVSTSA